MSKRSYYRRYRRTYPKQKWQITVVNPEPLEMDYNLAAGYWYAVHKTICQSIVPTNQAAQGIVSANNIVKVANFKIKGSYNHSGNLAESISVIIYAIFVPQGITPDSPSAAAGTTLGQSIFYAHPEWVLGWTRIDLDSQGSDNFSISSRLKRNLNSGDQIMLGVLVMDHVAGTGSLTNLKINFRATVQYYARAN